MTDCNTVRELMEWHTMYMCTQVFSYIFITSISSNRTKFRGVLTENALFLEYVWCLLNCDASRQYLVRYFNRVTSLHVHVMISIN